jgi:hypothetical protein
MPSARWKGQASLLECLVLQEGLHETRKRSGKDSNAWRPTSMGVIDDRILAIQEPIARVKQDLVPISFHEELTEAQHPIARRRPLAALPPDSTLLSTRERIEWLEVVDEGMLPSKLHNSAHEPQAPGASQEALVRLRQRGPTSTSIARTSSAEAPGRTFSNSNCGAKLENFGKRDFISCSM